MEELQKQARIWCCILYEDNDEHIAALKMAENMHNTIIMRHDFDKNKIHNHIIFKFDNGYYNTKLLKYLDLDFEKNNHLFCSLKDIKFKRIDDYIVYMTHYYQDDKHFYDPQLFKGGLRNYAINVCEKSFTPIETRILKVINYIQQYFNSDIDNKFKSDDIIFLDFYDKFGDIIIRKWSFFKGFINEYKIF